MLDYFKITLKKPQMVTFPSFFFGYVLLVGMACNGQESPLSDPSAKQSLLWEVKRPGEAPSYLLGTMHILCPEDARLSNELLDILDKVDKIYFEIDLDDMGQLLGALQAMVMRNDTSLSDILSKQELARVEQYFSSNSTLPLPFTFLQRIKPMLLSSMVAEKALPCEAANGMELLIMEHTKQNGKGKSIMGLETMAYQAGLFDSIPYKIQAQELLQAIDSPQVANSEVDSLIMAYRNQDLEKIERLTLASEGSIAGSLDLLLFGRNKNWVSQFEKIFQSGSSLIAVGAAHLAGSQGIVQLLKDKGYQVRPLKNNTYTMQKSL
jgi:uncharacterized protein YbaP (TraB family)